MDIKNLLNSMTLQEKIGELCLTGSSKDRVLNGISIGKYGSVLNHIGKDHINELQNAALNNNKKIPCDILILATLSKTSLNFKPTFTRYACS